MRVYMLKSDCQSMDHSLSPLTVPVQYLHEVVLLDCMMHICHNVHTNALVKLLKKSPHLSQCWLSIIWPSIICVAWDMPASTFPLGVPLHPLSTAWSPSFISPSLSGTFDPSACIYAVWGKPQTLATVIPLNVNLNYSRAETLTFFLESKELPLFLFSLRPVCKHCDCRLQCVNVENAHGSVPYFVTLTLLFSLQALS